MSGINFSEAAEKRKHNYTNPSKAQDLAHLEAGSDKDVKYDEDGNELDKHGFKVKKYPDGVTSVFKSVLNCTTMCGLDKNLMERIRETMGSTSKIEQEPKLEGRQFTMIFTPN